jgi:hypothetical protein
MEFFISLRKIGQLVLDKLNYQEITNVVSSGSLEFTDRTINNSRFNIDRDFGLFLDYSHQKPNSFSYDLKGRLPREKAETG